MKLAAHKLAGHLKNGPKAPLYWISGDEPLLVQEACDTIRASARQQGIETREVLHLDAHFSWSQFWEQVSNLSLFVSRKLIELRLYQGKLAAEGLKELVAYLGSPYAQDNLLVISSPKLETAQIKVKAFQQVQEQSVWVPIWPLEGQAWQQHMRHRAQTLGMQLTEEAVHFLQTHTEGNLLAAAQTLTKLQLAYPQGGALDLEQLSEYLQEDSRFSLFALVDACLLAQQARALHILAQLRASQHEAPLVVWALAREMRQLMHLRYHLDEGMTFASACKQVKIFEKRQVLYRKAVHRFTLYQLEQIHLLIQQVDLAIRGQHWVPPWDLLTCCVQIMARADVPDA
ncbi:DNA polymerase III, delta subunit [Allopseudospirillum japonicum]|uniref:DNA polymerase III subunit delta n=1 Tax=Allopseudospirillum japonicum TaxID=64971 RepID=A0A1H6QBR3_9GAMM|nr:DNA polymerase III subunit delta [Allopseudospirillum japonicum]SEI41188.1 DNA polymerase III, delta subunit [Allopseudospirillum japonicum]